ncbi:Paraquat-inducible protein A [Candidatus Paraburkholderia kirkii UZHbot1]|uniref:Paraquat-inducible protein A n=1 Tax=Candidatus Paraburkholderia kirkii UZHbot1 TaxID=1055526 RepID=G4M7H5_9BURK|nr:Paraquat-inducible protein A [Candidatus Paraburkholderia kirkii UZHbot1]
MSDPIDPNTGAPQTPTTHYTTASRANVVSCHACRLVQPFAHTVEKQRCTRCDAVVHRRHPDSIARTWALLISAAILYIPANLFPIMHTSSILGSEDDTTMSGVALFWNDGDYPLAAVIFIASILVPMLKLVTLGFLAISLQRRSIWRLRQRMTLFRIVEGIGRWSMLDVFVITLTIALVRFRSLAVITPEPGALAFASVVVLTMIASMQFDPRLMWDNIEPSGKTYD